MTITAAQRKSGPNWGNGVATSFPFNFVAYSADQVRVVVNDGLVETVLTSNYSVSLNPDQNASPGGTVTYPLSGSPLTSQQTITIIGNTSYEQTLALPQGGSYNPVVLERALDRIVMQVQQLREQLERAVKVPPNTPSPQEIVDSPAARANKILAFDANGNAAVATPFAPGTLAVSPFIETLLDDANASAARDTLGVQRTAFGLSLMQTADAAAARAALDVAQVTSTPTFTSLNGGPLGGLRNWIMNPLWQFNERLPPSLTTLSNGSSGNYFLDGWTGVCVGTAVMTVNRGGSGGPSAAFPTFGRVTVTTADTTVPATAFVGLEHRLHPQLANLPLLATGPVTLSFWVWAPVTGTYGVYFQNSTRTQSYVTTYTVSQADTWEYKVITLPSGVPAALFGVTATIVGFALMAGINLRTGALNTQVSGDSRAPFAQANAVNAVSNTFRIGPIQLERGSVATPFEVAPAPIMGAWVAARAQKLQGLGTISWPVAIGRATSATNVRFIVPFAKGSIFSGDAVAPAFLFDGSFQANGNAITVFSAPGPRGSAGIMIDGTTTGLTTGQAVEVQAVGGAQIILSWDI